MTALDTVTNRLRTVTGHEGRNGSWLCPAHGDRNPSLSVASGNDGVVMHCHAGCRTEDVVTALGLSMGDLFDTPKSNGQRRVLRTHDYVDEDGVLLYQTVRFEGTGSDRFRQRRPDGNGGWIWNLRDTRRVLYNLPLVLEAVSQGLPVSVAEGEHDADALDHANAIATTNPLGATNWRPEYTKTLAGAKICIFVDRDDTGRKRGAQLNSELTAAGCEILGIYEPVKGKDAAEVLGMGYDLNTGFQAITIDPPADDDQPDDNIGALPDGHRATDVGNADRLAALADGHIRYVHAWQKWIVYHDGAWRIDAGDTLVTELAKNVARRLFELAASTHGNKDLRERIWNWAIRSETSGGLANTVRLARGIPGVIVDHKELDQQPWLLNVANGTIDLRNGTLVNHNPEHLLTKIIPISYEPHAPAPGFEKFLKRIIPDKDVRAYLHRFVGYAATGLIREHVFPIWWGDGSNGKSTLIGLIRSALGDYAISAARDLFMATKYESHDTKYADLFGRRLATRTETKDGGNLDEARVKELTGGDPMKGRRMREDYWEFEPSHKLVLATNHKPRIEGTDHAIWRRVHLVPFTETIVEPELDPELPEKLQAELAGILTWIVQGCLAWQKHGLAVPNKVTAATAAYRGESDLVARFLDDCGIELQPDDPSAWERSSWLTDIHTAWCSDNGLEHNRQWQAATERLRELGAKPEKRQKVRGWRGVRGTGVDRGPV